MTLSLFLLPETAVVASSCVSALLGSASVLGIQRLRKKKSGLSSPQPSKNADMSAKLNSRQDYKTKADQIKESQASAAEAAKEFNKKEEAGGGAAYLEQRNWLLAVLGGESQDSRGDILRKFYTIGRHSSLRKHPRHIAMGSSWQVTWTVRTVQLHFITALAWDWDEEVWVEQRYSGSLKESVSRQATCNALPGTASDWEAFARLVEIAEAAGDTEPLEKVDRFIQLNVANMLLGYDVSSGMDRLTTEEAIAETGRRQEEIGRIGFEILVIDLQKWAEKAKAPRVDPVEAAKSRALKMKAEEAEATKAAAELEQEKARLARAEEAKASGGAVDAPGVPPEPLVGADGAITSEPIIEAFKEAYGSLTEAEQRAGNRYLERIKEAENAVKEAVDLHEATRERVTVLAEDNRKIALEKIEALLADSGTSRGAQLVRSLRVSNRYLLEQDAGV